MFLKNKKGFLIVEKETTSEGGKRIQSYLVVGNNDILFDNKIYKFSECSTLFSCLHVLKGKVDVWEAIEACGYIWFPKNLPFSYTNEFHDIHFEVEEEGRNYVVVSYARKRI